MSNNPLMQAIASEQRSLKEGEEFIFPDLKSPYGVEESLSLYDKLIHDNFVTIHLEENRRHGFKLGSMFMGGGVHQYIYAHSTHNHVMRRNNLATLSTKDVIELFQRLGLVWSHATFGLASISIIFNAWLLGVAHDDGKFHADSIYLNKDELQAGHTFFFGTLYGQIMDYGYLLLKGEETAEKDDKIVLTVGKDRKPKFLGSIKGKPSNLFMFDANAINIILSKGFSEMLAILSYTVKSIFCSVDRSAVNALVNRTARENICAMRSILVFFYSAHQLQRTLFMNREQAIAQVDGLNPVALPICRSEEYTSLFTNPRYQEFVESMMR